MDYERGEGEREWDEFEIIPISALSHHLYCERQNALIHVEGVFRDNELTAQGNLGHARIDQQGSFVEHSVRKEGSLPVFSDRLGLRGVADLVEFDDAGVPYPVDYKNGRVARWTNLDAQLCAIALCLEEMFAIEVPEGAIFHLASRRRRDVRFGQDLRDRTLNAIEEIRTIFREQRLPPPVLDRRCKRCSLEPLCMPGARPDESNPFRGDAEP